MVPVHGVRKVHGIGGSELAKVRHNLWHKEETLRIPHIYGLGHWTRYLMRPEQRRVFENTTLSLGF